MTRLLGVWAVIFVMLLVGCGEAEEGVDAIAEKVTGKEHIEKKRSMEKDIKGIADSHNKKQMDALKELEK
jgi:hypothetical protein